MCVHMSVHMHTHTVSYQLCARLFTSLGEYKGSKSLSLPRDVLSAKGQSRRRGLTLDKAHKLDRLFMPTTSFGGTSGRAPYIKLLAIFPSTKYKPSRELFWPPTSFGGLGFCLSFKGPLPIRWKNPPNQILSPGKNSFEGHTDGHWRPGCICPHAVLLLHEGGNGSQLRSTGTLRGHITMEVTPLFPWEWRSPFSKVSRELIDTWCHGNISKLVRVCVKSLQLCPTLCNPMDCSPPGSSVHGILQARILEWVALPSSRGSSPPRDRTWVSYISRIGRRFFTPTATWEAQASTWVTAK